MPQSLADRLKALGVKIGATHLPTPGPADRSRIEDVIPGAFRSTPCGETFICEQRFPADYRHGEAPLLPPAPLSMLARWAGEARLTELPLEALAFLDTETSGLAGGTGTYAFLVGVGRFAGGEFRLAQFFMRDPGEETAMLNALADFLAPAQALVTYNGKAFDIPLLRTRFALHSIPSPFSASPSPRVPAPPRLSIPASPLIHLDLLPLARRLWRERLPSRALKFIEENVLDMTRSSEEVPGYEIPWLYFDYLRTGDAAPLKGVFYHNAMDVVALAALLAHSAAMLHDPFDGRIQHGLDFIAVARLFEDLGQWEAAARLYEHGLQIDLAEADFWQAVRRLSILQKRRGDLGEAVRWWEQAAAQGHIYAHVELAKYCEHRLRDHAAALHWTQTALEHLRAAHMPAYARRHWLEELEHRLARLEAKLKAAQ